MELQSSADIRKDQDLIRKNLVGLDQQVHNNAVQCLLHAQQHGDTSLMRRLLVEVIDAKTGYRRQGLIVWMRTYTPMELTQDNINLSGLDPVTGNLRPWRVQEALENPFWSLKAADEVVKPMFQDTIMGKVNSAMKEFRAALANTVNGKPVDATKPFYDGVKAEQVAEFFNQVEILKAKLIPVDETKERRKAEEVIKRLDKAA